ncbi:MAG: hypothetical protein AB1488_02985 [Nitrospirota bacterium]
MNKIFSEIDKKLKLTKAKFLGGRGRGLSYRRYLYENMDSSRG